MAAPIAMGMMSSSILDRVKADKMRNADNRAEWAAYEAMTGKLPGWLGSKRRRKRGSGMSGWMSKVGQMAGKARDMAPPRNRTQPGPRIGALENIGRQREDYTDSQNIVTGNMFQGSSMRNEIMDHALLGRRFHSGDLNMINRRRRVQPRELDGGERLSFRNTQPNQGTFGIGQGINR